VSGGGFVCVCGERHVLGDGHICRVSVLWVLCAGCRQRFPVPGDTGPWAPEGHQVFVCTGCSEAAVDPRHCRSREVLERLAAALRESKESTQRLAQRSRRFKEAQL
jgi:hypothetical protein